MLARELAIVLAIWVGLLPVLKANAEEGTLEIPKQYEGSGGTTHRATKPRRAATASYSSYASSDAVPDSDDVDRSASTGPPPDLGSANDYVEQRDEPAAAPRYAPRRRRFASGGYSNGPPSGSYSYDPYEDDPYQPPPFASRSYGYGYGYDPGYRPSSAGMNWGGLIVGGLMLGLTLAQINAARRRNR